MANNTMSCIGTSISCGIYQLYSVDPYGVPGHQTDLNGPTIEDYTRALQRAGLSFQTGAPPKCAMLIASLTTKQERGVAFLRELGFKEVVAPYINPNTNNEVILFAKTFVHPVIPSFRFI
jgi:hypothetical protein